MKKHDIKDYLENHRGKYLLVNSLARRVRELQSGHKPLIANPGSDLSDVATEEFRQGMFSITTLDNDIDEPKTK